MQFIESAFIITINNSNKITANKNINKNSIIINNNKINQQQTLSTMKGLSERITGYLCM